MPLYYNINQDLEVHLNSLLRNQVLNNLYQQYGEQNFAEALNKSQTVTYNPEKKLVMFKLNIPQQYVVQFSTVGLDDGQLSETENILRDVASIVKQQKVGAIVMLQLSDKDESERLAQLLEEKYQLKTTVGVETKRDAFIRQAVDDGKITFEKIREAQQHFEQKIPIKVATVKGQYSMTPEQFKQESGYQIRVQKTDIEAELEAIFRNNTEREVPLPQCNIFVEPQKLLYSKLTKPRNAGWQKHNAERRRNREK